MCDIVGGHTRFGGGSIGEVVVEVGSMEMKLYLVVPASLTEVNGWLVGVCGESRREGLCSVIWLAALLFLLGLGSGSELCSTFLDFAIGKDNPRNFPLLATPTFHVKAVLYPEQSFPCSRHCVQYGLFRSHFL